MLETLLVILLVIIGVIVGGFIIAVIITAVYCESRKDKKRRPNDIWEDRKRNNLGLPWTFTRYGLDKERLFIDKGFFNMVSYEARLYRITDVSLARTLWQRIIGTGTILVFSSDRSLGNFKIRNIKNSMIVKELLSQTVEAERQKKRVYTRENMVEVSEGDNEDFDGDMGGGDDFGDTV
ncbi:MAG: PH domain-containing protein [Lachnospiraceae bacterium]|nr:PH domain-containing protein [Lachnospiraceae bacterium]